MKAEMPATSRPILCAKLGPMPQKPPMASPAKKTPIDAKGETEKRSLNATDSCRTSAGG